MHAINNNNYLAGLHLFFINLTFILVNRLVENGLGQALKLINNNILNCLNLKVFLILYKTIKIALKLTCLAMESNWFLVYYASVLDIKIKFNWKSFKYAWGFLVEHSCLHIISQNSCSCTQWVVLVAEYHKILHYIFKWISINSHTITIYIYFANKIVVRPLLQLKLLDYIA